MAQPVLAEGNSSGMEISGSHVNPFYAMRALARSRGNSGRGGGMTKKDWKNLTKFTGYTHDLSEAAANAAHIRAMEAKAHEWNNQDIFEGRRDQAAKDMLEHHMGRFEQNVFGTGEGEGGEGGRPGFGIGDRYKYRIQTPNGSVLEMDTSGIPRVPGGDALAPEGPPSAPPATPGIASKYIQPYQVTIINDPKLVSDAVKSGDIDKETAEEYMREMRENKTDEHGVVKSGPLFKPYTQKNKETGAFERHPQFQEYLDAAAKAKAEGAIPAGRVSKRGNVVGRGDLEAHLDASRDENGVVQSNAEAVPNPSASSNGETKK